MRLPYDLVQIVSCTSDSTYLDMTSLTSDAGSYDFPRVEEPKKEYMYVCKSCGSEWHDTKLHKGTCGNCGRGAYRNKTKVEMPVEEQEEPGEAEFEWHDEDAATPANVREERPWYKRVFGS